MTEGSARSHRPLVFLVMIMVAFAGVTTLDALVTLSSMSSPLARWSQWLSLLEHAGELAFGLAACFTTVRTLGISVSAVCASCLAALAISAQPGGSLALPISALVGALDVCIWAILIRELRSLPRNARNPAFLLTGLLAALVHLLAYALFSTRSLLGRPMALHGVGTVVALFILLVCVPRGAPEATAHPRSALPWRAILTLFGLALPARVATAVISQARLPASVLSNGQVVTTAAGSPWLELSAALLGQCGVLAAAAWLAFEPRRTKTASLAGWSVLVGAALVPCSMLADGAFTLLGSLGSGIVSATIPLLVLSAALLTPQRFVPIVLAGWFSSNFVVWILTSWIGHPASEDRSGQILLVISASLLMLGSAAGLLLIRSGGVEGDSHDGGNG